MNGSMCFHDGSVVIDDFNFVWAVRFPAETDAPLVIDANGVLPRPVALKRFQAIAGWDGKMVEFGDRMNLGEFAQDNALDVRRKRPGFPFIPKSEVEIRDSFLKPRITRIFLVWIFSPFATSKKLQMEPI